MAHAHHVLVRGRQHKRKTPLTPTKTLIAALAGGLDVDAPAQPRILMAFNPLALPNIIIPLSTLAKNGCFDWPWMLSNIILQRLRLCLIGGD